MVGGGPQIEASVRAMVGKMVHRGPDGEGLFIGPSFGLGMRRLSIIDLAGGQQPVFNEAGTLALVFNGEVYNFQELRRELVSRGHLFRSQSDTEAIVHAYEEWGVDCVHHLEGMFAFAIAETPRSSRPEEARVLLARDRLGIKPCYYAFAGGALLFASEVRALLATGLIAPRLSRPGLHSYLLFGSVGEPSTLVEGVFSLPPGHRMMVTSNSGGVSARPEPYWDFGAEALKRPDGGATSVDAAAGSLRSILENAVEHHLIADVPLGLFLSSGIDSTSLVALAACSDKARQGAGIHTLTVVFPEQEYSEAVLARQTAKRLGTTHRELLLDGEEMLARLNEAVSALDQPSMDGINTFFVSWAARQAGLKVALSGLGGDEIFGGYDTFRQAPRAQCLAALGRQIPAPVRRLTAAALGQAAAPRGPNDVRQKLFALWCDPDSLPHPYFYTRLLFAPQQVARLLRPQPVEARMDMQSGNFVRGGGKAPADAADPGHSYGHGSWPKGSPWENWLVDTAKGAEQLDSFTAISCLEARSYMVSTLLRDTDSMSMAHSLEVRVPFLDHTLVENVSRLPESAKKNGKVPKPLLVRALRDLLPDEVVYQRKRTFTLPWEHWVRGVLREEIAREVSSIAPALEPVLDGKAVEWVWSDFLQGRTRWSRVWSLFVLNRWAKTHLHADIA
jgi:asparagine synthase (glutamine-hydrolysing)